MFTWIPIHQETARRLLTFRNRQQELIDVLSEMQAEGLKALTLADRGADGKEIPLREIDPFTFLSNFNRPNTHDNRKALWAFLKKKWDLVAEVPGDFDGLPLMNHQKTWFIPFADERDPNHVPDLWEFFEHVHQIRANELDVELMQRCIGYKNTALTVLTMGMFWIRPETWISTDGKNVAYAAHKGSPIAKPKSAAEYPQWLTAMTELVGGDAKRFSHEAHLWAIGPRKLGRPFDVLFAGTDPNKILDRFGEAVHAVRNSPHFKPELLVTSLRQDPRLNVLYGDWTLLGYSSEGFRIMLPSESLEIGLLQLNLVKAYQDSSGSLFQYEGMFEDEDQVWREFIAFIPVIVSKFMHHKGSQFMRWNRKQAEALMTNPDERAKLLASGLQPDGEDDVVPPLVTITQTYTKSEALAELFIEEAQLDTILRRLRDKKNIILQGAPGVGKTFIAKRLAHLQMGERDESRIEMVQFHQSYSYEDFVQGIRPSTENGHFEVKNGIFHRLCKRAAADQNRDYFLVIDEINRGNLGKILGELMMLIETDKRGETLSLSYSGERFFVPENLHIIGTMNTADRSLSMVDYALRRRFSFITLGPGFQTDSFANHLVKRGVSLDGIQRIQNLMAHLNAEIAKDTINLGPGYRIGHSFFTPREEVVDFDLWCSDILEHEIGPLLDEYWMDDGDTAGTHKAKLLAGLQ